MEMKVFNCGWFDIMFYVEGDKTAPLLVEEVCATNEDVAISVLRNRHKANNLIIWGVNKKEN